MRLKNVTTGGENVGDGHGNQQAYQWQADIRKGLILGIWGYYSTITLNNSSLMKNFVLHKSLYQILSLCKKDHITKPGFKTKGRHLT